MTYRLALDLGTNSIGWAQLSLNEAGRPVDLIDGGVHIFDQGRKHTSLASKAADRRDARGMRRNRDRALLRKADLMAALVHHGLMPEEIKARKALQDLEPLNLRAAALNAGIKPHELGRALFHLNQRRGFKSNRKSESTESGKISTATQALLDQLASEGYETYGAFLNGRRQAGLSTRIRLNADGKAYEFYPTRALIEAEFDLLFDRQRGFGLTEASRETQEALRAILFRQRKLKPPLVGKCLYEPTEDRAARILPTAQAARIWGEVMNLLVRDPRQVTRTLSQDEQDKILNHLFTKPELKFDKMAELIGLEAGSSFNLQTSRRNKLLGDQAAAKLRGPFKKYAGLEWESLDRATQDRVVEKIIGYEEDEAIEAWLNQEFGFDAEGARKVASLALSPTRSNLCAKAMTNLIRVYEDQRLKYDKAVVAAGYKHHSDFRTGEVYETLPYYALALSHAVSPGTGDPNEKDEAKRYGRFPNPTVHIVLNRIRKLVNALIERDGKPAEIVIESGRELPLSAQARRKLENEQSKNTDANDKRAEKIEALGQRVTADALLRLALWEELAPDYRCVFSGKRVDQADALSAAFEVEHILPYSGTLDDSRANKTLCAREYNRKKGNRSPYEAFGHTPDYEAIMERVQNPSFPRHKRWRFGPEAMQRFEEKEGWLARQLTDSQYVARLAVQYLTPVCSRFEGGNKPCWATPGRLSALVRHTLGLNEVLGLSGKKNRNDHRHHFVDACVIGLMDPGFLQEIARVAKRSHDKGEQDRKIQGLIAEALGPQKETLRAVVEARAKTLVIAHRPDHSKGGLLLKETAYGFINKSNPETQANKKDEGSPNVSIRVEFPGNEFKNEQDLSKILSKKTHSKIYNRIMSKLEKGEVFKTAAEAVSKDLGIKKVRIGTKKNGRTYFC